MLKRKIMSLLILVVMCNVANACPCDDADKPNPVTVPQPQQATSANN